jgi:acyl-lipid Delta6-acetylenase / acyl-lipid (9-3)-desaturase
LAAFFFCALDFVGGDSGQNCFQTQPPRTLPFPSRMESDRPDSLTHIHSIFPVGNVDLMSTITVTEVAPASTNTKCVFVIDEREYDVTHFRYTHPGGHQILEQYHNKDATDAFHAFHGPEAHEQLHRLKSTPRPMKADKMTKEFRELRRKVEAAGLMERRYGWYVWKTLSTIAFWVLAMALGYEGHWFLSAVALGVFWQQSGWLGHEYAHHDVFANRRFNTFMAYTISNFFMGLSANWWKLRHNVHHAITNVLDADPDIDNLPLFCYDFADLSRLSTSWAARKFVPYQHYYFIPFTPLLKLIWNIQSVIYVHTTRTDKNEKHRRAVKFEAATLAAHYAWYFAYLWFLTPSWTAMFVSIAVTMAIAGAGIAMIVFLSHDACEIHQAAKRESVNFVELQVLTTRNFTPGPFMDWVAGGLNYQIEHHLFPSMPRCNLNATSKLVKKFCLDNGLPYQCEDWDDCVGLLLQRLKTVAMEARRRIAAGKA